MRPGDRLSEINEELPEERQLLARALRHLHDCTAGQDGKRMSHTQLIHAMRAGPLAPSSLCRYFSGTNVPSERVVIALYKAIDERVVGPLPLTCEILLELRDGAASADGRRAKARQRRVEQRALTLAADMAESGAPPVPRDTGDRQANKFAGLVPQAAAEAIRLAAQGQYAQTVTLLSRLPEHLNTDEVALCIVHFRHRHYDDLADTLIKIYGRDHREDHRQTQIIRLSITLREHELQKDANALLEMLLDSKSAGAPAGGGTAS
ncbi:hypothetical protein [Labedaea rhizosphaerae]|uniref:Uncharacterized protein n=1 Tax=Labedaea rhizosphaerae TaxID=598644 RepID=A0A4R6SJ41_LABRH|nr:hypothetical protein [Labedaea rhizosphaerae]TDQ04326.1 hypothetical protein EV186_101270 [Labedaea rhizosphaerae]